MGKNNRKRVASFDVLWCMFFMCEVNGLRKLDSCRFRNNCRYSFYFTSIEGRKFIYYG